MQIQLAIGGSKLQISSFSKSDNSNFGQLNIEPHAMKYMLRGIKHNACNNTALPSFLRNVTYSSGNHPLVTVDNKYINALEQVFKTVIEKTQIATKRFNNFTVTVRKGMGDAIKITTSKDIIPKGEELGHSLILKKPAQYANAEYIAHLRGILEKANVCTQTAELGKVDMGGGGTIAYILALYGMNVIDCGVPVLSMHSPWEAISKADLYEAYRGYKAFLREAEFTNF